MVPLAASQARPERKNIPVAQGELKRSNDRMQIMTKGMTR
jgi:hypothetical protein